MLQIQKQNQNWLPSIFDEFFLNDNLSSSFSHRPSMNIIENEKEFKVQVVATGFSKEEAKVSVNNDEIQISLVHKDEKKEKSAENYLRHEFSMQSYNQSFIIPDDVETDKISASLENGILSVVLPKQEKKLNANLSRQIAIC